MCDISALDYRRCQREETRFIACSDLPCPTADGDGLRPFAVTNPHAQPRLLELGLLTAKPPRPATLLVPACAGREKRSRSGISSPSASWAAAVGRGQGVFVSN